MNKVILVLITATTLVGCAGNYVRPYPSYRSYNSYGYTPVMPVQPTYVQPRYVSPNDVYIRPCYTYRGGC